MKRIYIYFGVCFILLVYSLSQNTVNINKIKELEGKIKKLERAHLSKPKGIRGINQANKVETQEIKQNQIKEDEAKQKVMVDEHDPDRGLIADTTEHAGQMAVFGGYDEEGMTKEANQHHLRKKSDSKATDVYDRINSLAERLKLNNAQKDEFWVVMLDCYEEYQRIKAAAGTSSLQQLRDQTMESLKQILSSQQIEEIEKANLLGFFE